MRQDCRTQFSNFLPRKSIFTNRWLNDPQRTLSSRKNLTSAVFPTVSTAWSTTLLKELTTRLHNASNLTMIIRSKRISAKSLIRLGLKSGLEARPVKFWAYQRLSFSSWPRRFRMLLARKFSQMCKLPSRRGPRPQLPCRVLETCRENQTQRS